MVSISHASLKCLRSKKIFLRPENFLISLGVMTKGDFGYLPLYSPKYLAVQYEKERSLYG